MVMYISMVRKGIRPSAMFAFCLLALVPALAPAPLAAEERAVELGRDARWKDMRILEGVSAVPGRWGFSDLVLSAGEYPVDGTAELLFHFDGPGQSDATGAWEYAQGEPALSEATAAMGQSSAAFSGAPAGVRLRAPPGSLFSPGATWEDFTIEFWLYPATLSNGETILAWEGSLRDGGARVPQGE